MDSLNDRIKGAEDKMTSLEEQVKSIKEYMKKIEKLDSYYLKRKRESDEIEYKDKKYKDIE